MFDIQSARSFAVSVLYRIGTASQNGKILLHLIKAGSISQLEALELYRVHRLASRINDLKNKGVALTAVTLFDLTGVRYVRYSL